MSLEAAAAEDIIDLASDYFEGIVELYLHHRPEVMKLLRPHSMAIKRMENCSRVTSTTLLAATGLVRPPRHCIGGDGGGGVSF